MVKVVPEVLLPTYEFRELMFVQPLTSGGFANFLLRVGPSSCERTVNGAVCIASPMNLRLYLKGGVVHTARCTVPFIVLLQFGGSRAIKNLRTPPLVRGL